MKLEAFFHCHPVFTLEECSRFLTGQGTPNLASQRALLAYHRRTGRLLMIRRGLYAVVPPGGAADTLPVDAFLVASRLAPDAVLAYHAALELHGRAYSVFHTLTYLTASPAPAFDFRGVRFKAVRHPAALVRRKSEFRGVVEADRQGLAVRVTSLERTLVDVLARPELAGGPEEAWRSLESVEYFDFDQVLAHVRLLGCAAVAAKTGFFLEQHREALQVPDAVLRALENLRPRQTLYFDRRRASGVYIARWRLVVPKLLAERSFAEVP